MVIKLTDFPSDSNWVEGVVGNREFLFTAKVFDEGSKFGIEGGRVSKILIRESNKGWEKAFAHYDRGWDVMPEEDWQQDILVEVVHYLENTPKRFD